jgi:hypothetical protein
MVEDGTSSGEPVEQPPGDEPEEICHPDGRIEHPGVRHETSDVRLRAVLVLVALACCVLAMVGYAVWRFYWFQAAAQADRKASPYPLSPGLSAPLPPEPRLEQLDRIATVESPEVSKRLAAQEKALHRYGRTAEKGFVHIPIQQAIKAVAGTLPVAQQPPPGAAIHNNGLLDAGASNSGRMFRGPLP